MPDYKVPGVYLKETTLSGPSISPVDCSNAFFIGYTAKAQSYEQNLQGVPTTVSSMAEFERLFGGEPTTIFNVASSQPYDAEVSYGNQHLTIQNAAPCFRLYHSVRLYFENGGKQCYILSVGLYENNVLLLEPLESGIAELEGLTVPGLLLIPDAVGLAANACYQLQNRMLSHCGEDTRYRFAILDIHNAASPDNHGIADFRNNLNNTNVGGCGAAYFPWLNSLSYSAEQINYTCIELSGRETLANAIHHELGKSASPEITKALGVMTGVYSSSGFHDKRFVKAHKGRYDTVDDTHSTLNAGSMVYRMVMQKMMLNCNVIPPCGAVAGVIVRNDVKRGIWKAPANLTLVGGRPTVSVSTALQEDLNNDADGKSVNAIRTFEGKGTVVWGARTLLSTDHEVKYINVARALMFVEQSIYSGIRMLATEDNNARLWSMVSSIVEQFLYGMWRSGAFVGSHPDQAYFVKCGLGETMSTADVSEDRLIVMVGVALLKPAEFIVKKLQMTTAS
ncbi:phage tail sheath family protein [Alteromonas sp. H39]|uniref:phage tail sheath family protein n=1 Tax=Alteromonas sp. H39 TaxID=3389876 RepID=UPI0039E1D462